MIGSQVGQFLMRRKAERKEQRRSQDLGRFRAALDAAAEPVLLVDARTGAYIDFNEAACRTFGYSRQELLKLTVGDIRVDRPRERILQDYKRLEAASPAAATTWKSAPAVAGTARFSRWNSPGDWSRPARGRSSSRPRATLPDAARRPAAGASAEIPGARRALRQLALAQRQPAELIERAVQAVLEALGAEAVATSSPSRARPRSSAARWSASPTAASRPPCRVHPARR